MQQHGRPGQHGDCHGLTQTHQGHRAHLAGGTQPCALLAVKTRKGTVAIEGLIHARPERLAHRGLSITNITSSR